MPRTNTLIPDHRQRDHSFFKLTVDMIRFRFAHGNEHACGAELIAVVINGAGIDGGKVRDKEARMKGAEVDDKAGQQA